MATTINITADGTTTQDVTEGAEYAISIGGSFGSGTLSIQWNDGSNANEYPSGSFTAEGGLVIVTPTDQVDFVVSGSTTPDIDITLSRIEVRNS